MGHYINLGLKKAKDILSLYGCFQEVQDITPLSLGISNSNYKITAQDQKLLLKISNDKDITQLKKEQDILHFLKKSQFPYSLDPFPLLNGELVYHCPPYFGVVFPFINGAAPTINSQSCHEIGKALATLHLISLNHSLPPHLRLATEVGHDATMILEYVEKAPSCPPDFAQTFSEVFPDRLESYLSQKFQKGIIHGDLYYDNTLFQKNKLIALVDFEQAGHGEFIFDIGVSISGTCLGQGQVDLALMRDFLRGYEQVRPLLENEKEHLYNAVLVGLLSISMWRIKRFTEGNLDPLKATSYRELSERARIFKKTLLL